MLWFRKAYALWTESPVRGKLRFLSFAVHSLFGRGNVEQFDLSFPSLSDYIPLAMRTSFRDPPLVNGVCRPNKYDVVVLGIIDFDFRFQRPQQIATVFARRGHRVLWVSPSRFLPPESSRPFEVIELHENIWEVRLRAPDTDIYRKPLSAEAAAAMLRDLLLVYADCGMAESCIIAQIPFWRRLAVALRERTGSVLLYDCMDDWDTFPDIGRFNVEEEAALARECNVLIVTAARLREKFAARGLQPLLVRNGADFELFNAPATVSAFLAEAARPVIGYFGAIADWVDIDLIAAAAKARPHYSFVLAGNVFGNDVGALHRLPNVRMLGLRPYEEMPCLLHGFDVCMIPFKLNRVTQATDPVKLYEYFSQGKPVVATGLPELEPLRELVYMAKGARDFARLLDEALAEKDASKKARRIQFASENTWAARVDVMDAAIREAFPLVSVLIVTHNSAAYIQTCLESLYANTAYPRFEVIVVDNASSDETLDLARAHPMAHLIAMPENTGFAAANNVAVRESKGQYLILLNADTVVPPRWLGRLLAHFRKDATLGLAGPMTNFAGNELKVNPEYTDRAEMERFAEGLYRKNRGTAFDVGVVPLFCGMIPRKVWTEAGPLDERFEIGMFEDDDFSIRVRKAGYRVAGAKDCFVHHFGQGSFGQLSAANYQTIFDRNRRLFETKWQRPWTPHAVRAGVRPPGHDRRFDPAAFGRSAADRVSTGRV